MKTMTSRAIEKAAQKTATQLASMMLHLQRRYDFSLTDYPPKESTENVAAVAGQNFAGMFILELKNCTNYPVEQLALSTTKIRHRYAGYLPSKEFRQATKSYLCAWALLEADKRKLDMESTGWLVSSVDYLANMILSPIGNTDIATDLATQGWHNPLQFHSYGTVDPNEEQVADILCRLPDFLGVLDFADAETTKAILGMFPESLVSPALYEDPFYYGSDSMAFLDTLHESLCHRYPSLEGAYEVEVSGLSCKSVIIAEFEGEFAPYGDYRLLAARINFKDTPGSDVYLALHTPYMFRSVLLVSEEIANDTGPGVVRYVYDAYAQVLSDETGEWVDIDELEYGGEDEDDF